MPKSPHQAAGGLVPGFELGAAIGKGGFATVYRARQVSLDRDVAVKIDQRVLDDERNARRFLREATASALISSHPHVVSLIDAGTTRDNRPYLAMELCDNGSVAQLVKREGPMPAADVVELGIAISGALAAAHERGILHRDIKPSNILIDPYGTPRLGDFGLAALSSKDEEMSVTLEALTPAYAAPESFEQAPPSKRADVWAFGATLYSLLTGIAPRHGEDGSPQTVAEIIQTLYRPLPPAQVPGAQTLMSLIWKATAPQKEQRFADGTELHAAMLELRGRFGRPHNVLAGGEVTRMTPGAPQQQQFPRPLPTPVSAGRGVPAMPPPRGPRLAALDPPTRPRRAWPVVVTGFLAVAGVSGAIIASQLADNQNLADQSTASTVAPRQTDAPADPEMAEPGGSPVCYENLPFLLDSPQPGLVDCAEPHGWEVFASGSMAEDMPELTYEAIFSDPAVEELCTQAKLIDYTGPETRDMRIDVKFPTQEEFDAGDRSFECVAGLPEPTTGSIRK